MKLFLLPIILAFELFAGIYDYKVDNSAVNSVKPNTFMYGSFQEIIRFEMLWFENEELSDSNTIRYNNVINTIKDYQQNGTSIRVTILGHTDRPTDDENELTIDSDTYANNIQNLFRYSLDTNESDTKSTNYANNIKEMFLDENISKEILYVEQRQGNDVSFTDTTSYTRDLSNGVLVSIYVLKPKNINSDGDGDGIFDRDDKCPNTPANVKVNKNGCPLDTDGDGVYDYQDKCPNTPTGVSVDKNGCPLDTDGDGIYDYKDKCPDTPTGLNVDLNGCLLKQTLKINFAIDSAKITKNSYLKVIEFANFLKENPYYNVEITGHTDSSGKATHNMILSQKRANMIKKALIFEGVEDTRLTTLGKGEIEPIASNRSVEERRMNRRIEIELSIKK